MVAKGWDGGRRLITRGHKGIWGLIERIYIFDSGDGYITMFVKTHQWYT